MSRGENLLFTGPGAQCLQSACRGRPEDRRQRPDFENRQAQKVRSGGLSGGLGGVLSGGLGGGLGGGLSCLLSRPCQTLLVCQRTPAPCIVRSSRIAKIQITMPPTSPMPRSLRCNPSRTVSPTPRAPIMEAITTMESASSVVWLMPCKIVAPAKGSWTLTRRCHGVAPKDFAA